MGAQPAAVGKNGCGRAHIIWNAGI